MIERRVTARFIFASGTVGDMPAMDWPVPKIGASDPRVVFASF
jgi:hypothetical protein